MKRPSSPIDQGVFSVERLESDGVKHLYLNGVIDEFADLSFFKHLQGRVVIHLAGVRRINSFGVRLWMDLVRVIPEEAEVTYVEVATSMVEQMNMVRGFFGRGKVDSFVAPMVCDTCGETTLRIFTLAECMSTQPPSLPEGECGVCRGGTLELDDIEEQYLAFLRDFTDSGPRG